MQGASCLAALAPWRDMPLLLLLLLLACIGVQCLQLPCTGWVHSHEGASCQLNTTAHNPGLCMV
jgi:hypothetical protein